jgi:transcriptional regulator with XRE-family HTH domain
MFSFLAPIGVIGAFSLLDRVVAALLWGLRVGRKLPHSTDVHVGQRIRERRMMKGLSQGALAEAGGVSFQQIQKYEKGANRVSASRLQQFAKLLEVSVSFFFDGLSSEDSKRRDRSHDLAQQLLATRDGIDLAKAFVAIEDASQRRSIVTMAENIAKQETSRKRVRR